MKLKEEEQRAAIMTPSTVQQTPAPLTEEGVKVQDMLRSAPKGIPADDKSLGLWNTSRPLAVASFQEHWPDNEGLFDPEASF